MKWGLSKPHENTQSTFGDGPKAKVIDEFCS